MAEALIALGGNLDDPPLVMRRALELLSRHPAVSLGRVASVYRTVPIGAQAGNEFYNSAASLQTTLTPESLLDLLLSVEDHLGRVRQVHWGPRLIDLDLIAMEQQVISTERLTLPHPAMWYRRFVLDPLCEVAADWVHPVLHRSVIELRSQLQQRPLRCCADLDEVSLQSLKNQARTRFPEPEVLFVTRDENPAIVFSMSPEPDCPLSVTLPAIDAPACAVEILQAMLDEPQGYRNFD